MSSSHQHAEVGRGVPRQPLGTLIFRKGLLGAEQLLEALEEGNRTGRRLGEILVERGWVSEDDLARVLAEQHGLPAIDLVAADIQPEGAQALPPEDSDRLGVAVLRFEQGTPVVAVCDPGNAAVVAELTVMLGARPSLVVTSPTRLASVLGHPSRAPELRLAGEAWPEPGPVDVAEDATPAEELWQAEPVGPALHDEPAAEASPFQAEPFVLDERADEPEPPAEAFDLVAEPPVDEPVEASFEEPVAEAAPTFEQVVEHADEPAAQNFIQEPTEHPEAEAAAFEWAPFLHAEPVDAEAGVAEAGVEAEVEVEVEVEAEPSEETPAAVAAHDVASYSPWPEALAARDHVAIDHVSTVDADDEPDPVELPADEAEVEAGVEAEPSEEAAATLEAHDDSSDDLSPWREALAAPDHVAIDPVSTADAADEPDPVELPADEPVVAAEPEELLALVLRLATGETIELAQLEASAALARAAEIVERLVQDEGQTGGWTAIDGRHFRTAAILSVDLTPVS